MKNKSRKTKLCIGVISVIILCVIAFVLSLLIDKYNEDKEYKEISYPQQDAPKVPTITFYEADFEENIFENVEYIQKNSFVKYTKCSVSTYILSKDDAQDDEYAEFFADYFEKLKTADKSFSDMFSENYKHSYAYIAKPETEFAPQMIYDIEVLSIEAQSDMSAVLDTKYAFFEVKYKIFHNNGTHRLDLPENGVKPLLYKLSNSNGAVKIEEISDFPHID